MSPQGSESDASTSSSPSESRILQEARLALFRAARSDFGQTPATDAERKRLLKATPPIEEAIAQDYAGWRKSILYLASAFFIVAALFHVINYQSVESSAVDGLRQSQPHLTEEQAQQQVRQQFGASNLETLDLVPLLSLLALLAATIITVLAGRAWSDVRRSRRLARRAWYLLIGVPLVLAIIPWSRLLDFSHMTQEQAKGLGLLLGLMMGMQMIMLLGPKLLAILPGILRSSLTLKTLLPETSLPGWMAACVAPFYVMLLVLVTAPLNQWHGGPLLLFGLVALILGGLIYLRHIRSLVRPSDREAASRSVARVRVQALFFNAIGLLLLTVFLLQLDVIEWNAALSFLATAGGSLFLMTVVACDLLLAVMDISFEQGRLLFESDASKTLSKRLSALGASGLTALRTSEDSEEDA